MSFLEVIILALGLAMDAFAVALASSVVLRKVSPRQVFRFGFHFGLFQALMPVLGWLAGLSVQRYIESWDHWVAFALLAAIGSKALWSAFRGDGDEGAEPADPTRGWSLVVLSVATSIDALAVGLSLAMLRVAVWGPSVAIGVITAALTSLGMLFGARLGERFGKAMEVMGGLVLIGIGVKIVLDHMLK
jgi:manganese efflux pump family protein